MPWRLWRPPAGWELAEEWDAFGILPLRTSAIGQSDHRTAWNVLPPPPPPGTGVPCPAAAAGPSDTPAFAAARTSLPTPSEKEFTSEKGPVADGNAKMAASCSTAPAVQAIATSRFERCGYLGLAFKNPSVEHAFAEFNSKKLVKTDILIQIFFAVISILAVVIEDNGSAFASWTRANKPWDLYYAIGHCGYLVVIAASSAMDGWYAAYRNVLIPVRALMTVVTCGSAWQVPMNAEYRKSLASNPETLLMGWIYGMPLMHFVAIVGMKGHFHLNLLVQLIFLLGSSVWVPSMCTVADSQAHSINPVVCTAVVGFAQFTVLVILPCLINWWSERCVRNEFVAVQNRQYRHQ
eukprot:jgi/Botrbrau1/23016/Bobra.136_1s0008.1